MNAKQIKKEIRHIDSILMVAMNRHRDLIKYHQNTGICKSFEFVSNQMVINELRDEKKRLEAILLVQKSYNDGVRNLTQPFNKDSLPGTRTINDLY